MEFNEKLQELRKSKKITQEELANELFVSRTAVTKWESGKGYPNIDSLKAIAKYFNVTLDTLLSNDELLTAAENDKEKSERRIRDIIFGILDISLIILLFLPIFGQEYTGSSDTIESVSIFQLNVRDYVKIPYFIGIILSFIWGALILSLQTVDNIIWLKIKNKVSLGISAIIVLFFILSTQPYAAIIAFIFLTIKALSLIKW